MATPSPSIRALARRLVDLEAKSRTGSEPQTHEALRICEKLRTSVTRFAGRDGFASLLRRALALAAAEVPSLHGVTLNLEGCLEGLEGSPSTGDQTAVAITAYLLGLLVTFIGEPITLRLMRETWPDLALEE